MKLGLRHHVPNVFRSGVGDCRLLDVEEVLEQVSTVEVVERSRGVLAHVTWMVLHVNKESLFVRERLWRGSGEGLLAKLGVGREDVLLHGGLGPASGNVTVKQQGCHFHVVVLLGVLEVVVAEEPVDDTFHHARWVG